MAVVRWFSLSLIIAALGAVALPAAEKLQGELSMTIDGSARAGGSVTVELDAVERNRNRSHSGTVANRDAFFALVPYRWNLFDDQRIDLTAARTGERRFQVDLPTDLATGWYILIATVADDDGNRVSIHRALSSNDYRKFLTRRITAVRSDQAGPHIAVHTEHDRCVYSPGEEFRVFVSARGQSGVDTPVIVGLYPLSREGRPTMLARGQLSAGRGEETTLAFDISATASAMIAPGDYRMTAIAGREVVDSWRVRFITAERPSGGARWAHTFPHGTGGGTTGQLTLPDAANSGRRQGHIDNVLTRIHNASLWVNLFGNNHPVLDARPQLPEADAADLPPVAAQGRPSLTRATYQAMMAAGISLGVTMGYGEDYKAETYMPLPTIHDLEMDTLARKYLNGALGYAAYPHFVAAYADYYGHVDYSGGGEIAGEQRQAILDSYWEQARAAAGIGSLERPYRFNFDRKKMPKALRDILENRDTRRAFDGYLNAKRDEHGGDKKWFEKHYDTASERMRIWREAWTAAGVNPIPDPPTYVPLPELDEANRERVGPQAAYDYASFALRGTERIYGRVTETIESELPAVFTIHNKGTMNHSSVSHAWTGFRTPNIDPAYLTNGASAISVSEWNLDSVPKPYFLTTFYNRPLVDRGIPVYRQGLWKQAGSPTRWMRDAVFFAGRQIHMNHDQAGNMTWSHQGSDQTTYASNERMSSVTEFLSWYSDLFNHLQPVREVGLYVPPLGGPWGTGVTRGHYVGMVASMMSDYQVHMVSHGDVAEGGLNRYPIIYAPSLHSPDNFYPFETEGFKAYLAQGGAIVGSQAPDYYYPEEVYSRYGISWREVPQLDDNGQPRRNRDGSTRMTKDWNATDEQWAQVTRDYIWGDFPGDRVIGAAIDVHDLFTHIDEKGNRATHRGSHWTGHHKWAGYRGSALHQFSALQDAFATFGEPAVIKDQPEVFTNLCVPEDGSSRGMYLFASNWTQPGHPELHQLRVPQGFFKSMVEPVQVQLKVRGEIGAVYDLIGARAVPFTTEGDRVVFTTGLDSVEGRIFALYPEAVASAALITPTQVTGGTSLQARFELRGASGSALGVLGAVRVELLDDAGNQLVDLHRALPGDGALPALAIPINAGAEVTLRVTDSVTGQRAETTLAVAAARNPVASPADAVTVFRGDQIHAWLNSNTDIQVISDAGQLEFGDDGISLGSANPNARTAASWASDLARSLSSAGIQTRTATNEDVVGGQLYAHPWTGKMARYRQRHSVPGELIDGPVIVIGNPTTNRYLRMMDQAMVAQRSLGHDNVGPGRAVIAWVPRAFSPQHDCVVVAASDDAGVRAAIEALTSIAHQSPGEDSYYTAREATRFAWSPSEVVEHKERRGLLVTAEPLPVASGASQEIIADQNWSGLTTALGTAIFSIDASEGGVAVGTKSWARPTGLLSPDGAIRGFWGGGAEVTPRDVAVSANGRHAFAGYSLLGRVAAYGPQGQHFIHRSPIVFSNGNPYGWDTFKDSDRQLGISPDHQTAIAIASAEEGGIIAYDANSGNERWRIARVGTGSRPRGGGHPEIAFSPDSTRVLLTTRVEDAPVRATVTVTQRRWDESRNNYNKRDTFQQEYTFDAIPTRDVLMLVDVASGRPVWEITTAFELVDAETRNGFWKPGGKPKVTIPDPHRPGREVSWEGSADAVPIVGGQPIRVPERITPPFWHLYSAVGPNGDWAIASTREAKFSLLDDSGNILRTWEPRHLPRELNAGKMIPPRFLAGADAERMLAFAPQSRALFRFRIVIGSPTERNRAREAELENIRIMRRIKDEVNNSRNYGNYGNNDYLNAFVADIRGVPGDLAQELRDRMARVPAERRAGRKRDSRFFSSLVQRIDRALYQEDAALLDAAVGLEESLRVDLDAMIHDAATDQRLRTAYVGCWDQTVRAIDLDTGNERWRTPVIGGCRIAVVSDASGAVSAVYAGGSRGDVYRLDPTSGAILWHVNITEATNALSE